MLYNYVCTNMYYYVFIHLNIDMYDILACVHASVQIIVILGDSTPKGAKTS